jgi:hypothetical protein
MDMNLADFDDPILQERNGRKPVYDVCIDINNL